MKLTPHRGVYLILALTGVLWVGAGVGFARIEDHLWLTRMQPWLCFFAGIGSLATAVWLYRPNVAVAAGVLAVLAGASRFLTAVIDMFSAGERESVLRVSVWGLISLFSLAFWSGVAIPTAAFLGHHRKGTGNGEQAPIGLLEHDDGGRVPSFGDGSGSADVQHPEAHLSSR